MEPWVSYGGNAGCPLFSFPSPQTGFRTNGLVLIAIPVFREEFSTSFWLGPVCICRSKNRLNDSSDIESKAQSSNMQCRGKLIHKCTGDLFLKALYGLAPLEGKCLIPVCCLVTYIRVGIIHFELVHSILIGREPVFQPFVAIFTGAVWSQWKRNMNILSLSQGV